MEALKTRRNLEVRVTDVFVIPDIAGFLRENLDKHFGRFSKMDWTQHQWRVSKIEVSYLITFMLASWKIVVVLGIGKISSRCLHYVPKIRRR